MVNCVYFEFPVFPTKRFLKYKTVLQKLKKSDISFADNFLGGVAADLTLERRLKSRRLFLTVTQDRIRERSQHFLFVKWSDLGQFYSQRDFNGFD